MAVETPIYIDDILKVLGWSRSKFFTQKDHLLKDKALFYARKGLHGNRVLASYGSRLMDWQLNHPDIPEKA